MSKYRHEYQEKQHEEMMARVANLLIARGWDEQVAINAVNRYAFEHISIHDTVSGNAAAVVAAWNRAMIKSALTGVRHTGGGGKKLVVGSIVRSLRDDRTAGMEGDVLAVSPTGLVTVQFPGGTGVVDISSHELRVLAKHSVSFARKWLGAPSPSRDRLKGWRSVGGGGPTDRSQHPTIVEYAVHTMMKGKSPSAAAKDTVKKHSGTENMFFGPGVTTIRETALEDALWERLTQFAIRGMSRMKESASHYALGATIQHFNQKPAVRKELKSRVIKELGRNPFTNDDGS